LRISTAIGRLRSELFVTGADGQAEVALDTSAFPTPTGTAIAGQTWYFQAWYRGAISGAATSNFTSAISVELR
jgi:hypothetical protein